MMRSGKGWQYFWRNYAFFLVLGCMSVFVMFILLPEVKAERKTETFRVLFINTALTTKEAESFLEKFERKLGGDCELRIEIMEINIKSENPDFAKLSKFTAQMAAGELDVLVGDRDFIQYYVDLDGMLAIKAITADQTTGIFDSKKQLSAIALKKTDLSQAKLYLAIPKKTEKEELAKYFLDKYSQID